MLGKEVRLKRLFKYSGRTFILPMDHGITIGPAQGLGDIRKVVGQVSDRIDAVIVHKGLVPQIIDCLGGKGCELIVHLSASTLLSPDPDRKEIVTSVEQAIKMGAGGVSVHVNLGSQWETKMLKDLGYTAEYCDSWGMPLVAMMYVRDGKKESEYEAVKVRHAARVAEELGADIVKVNYTGDVQSFSEVIQGVKIPVIIAGGPRVSSDDNLLATVAEAVQGGARGVAVGRNLFQHSDPAYLAGRIRSILDE